MQNKRLLSLFQSIQFRFYIFVLALLLIVFALLNFFPILSSRDAIFKEKQESLSSRGSTTATAIASLGHMSQGNISEILEILDMDKYSEIVVVDTEGQIIYSSSETLEDSSELDDLMQAVSEEKTIFHSFFNESAFTSMYSTPISSQGSIIGGLYLKEVDTEQADIIISVQNRIRWVAFVAGFIAILFAFIFSRTILHRFYELVHSMRIVANGDYSHRLVVKGSDEVTALGNEFNEMTAKFQAIEMQRHQFVSDASHELKTPVASIKLLSDSMVNAENMSMDTVKEFASDISSSADRLQHLTEDLLSLSRMDDAVHLSEEPVDLKPVIIDALVSMKPIANEHKVKIKCSLDEGCVVMATVDDAFHIIYNLMDNAVKYNVEGGTVDIILSLAEEEIILQVKDTGIGIPESERLNVFTRFYRVDKARSRSSGGTGLGLSIVHDAVRAHNGTITIGANKPQGSVFIITFPRPSDEETKI